MSHVRWDRDQGRLVSLDACRGLVMLAMASNGLAVAQVAKAFPDSWIWQNLAYQLDHVAWTGCAFWDLIQPSFMFIVGVALPFSYGRRADSGESFLSMLGHALWRAVVLVLFAILLASNGKRQTDFIFTNVLGQIGLGYIVVFLVGRYFWAQLVAVVAILGAYWYAFYQHPLPGSESAVVAGLPQGWQVFTSSLAAHWNPHTNYAADFDRWFLNLFPRSEPFVFNAGGYQTLNFVPSIATMIFGAMTGMMLRSSLPQRTKLVRMIFGGIACLAFGMLVDHTIWPTWFANSVEWAAGAVFGGNAEMWPFIDRNWTLCPIVKRIWTPSWTVFSTGWALLLLAGFFYVIELKDKRRWAFPFVVVGMNSITTYILAQLAKPWIWQTIKTHFGPIARAIDASLGSRFDITYLPMIEQASVVLVLWLVCWWMFRRRLFIRI